jgi:2-polyprenyl-6-hydroxyphenyl methylase/3-demethylubiquinone-9 3-methyltransferase
VHSLQQLLDVDRLDGSSFLDVGCGSGLFSLAARRLGARVRSFDYDPEAVACSEELRRRFSPNDPEWMISRGDVLDQGFLRSMDRYDVVYAWGVLHHTGDMWKAMENVCPLVKGGGLLALAVYNDQGWASEVWRSVKWIYVHLPPGVRPVVVALAAVRIWGPTMIRDLLRGRPGASWRSYQQSRAMSPWVDLIDWVGGYPFEVARPEAVIDLFARRGLRSLKVISIGKGRANNQFLLQAPEGTG